MSDLVDVLEAAYRVRVDERTWLQGIVDAWAPALGPDGALCALYFDVRGEAPVFRNTVVSSGFPFSAEQAAGLSAVMPPRFAEKLSREPRLYTAASEWSGLGAAVRNAPSWRKNLPGYADSVSIRALDTVGRGVILFRLTVTTARVTAADARLPLFVAAHIVSGLRLREAAAGGHALEPERADAVLDGSGRVVHAVGEARARTVRHALAAQGRQIDRARGALRRRDPEEAVAIWRGLVAGRWSLVDHVDADGRRFLVARRNEPAAAASARLTPRERQVTAYAATGHPNKVIAYALGLATSTVATLLARAARKLSARSRVELIRIWRAQG